MQRCKSSKKNAKTLAVGAALGLAMMGAQPAQASLIGLYTFDNATNLGQDTSGNNNHATNYGATYTGAGYQGGAAFFNGTTSFLESPINVSPTALPQMTWGAWVKPNQTNSIRTVLSADNGGFDRGINLDQRIGGDWGAFTGSGILDSNIAPSTTQYTFLAGVYNQATNSLTYYVNGQSFTTTTSFGPSFSIFDIGRNPFTGGTEYFSGSIDNVFVYNEALSSEQINTIRTTGFAETAPVPEPSTYAMMGLMMLGIVIVARRKKASQMQLAPVTA